MEYGLIFHGTRTVKYYCKNTKYRINIYIICHQKKIVIERSRDLIYLKFVATDFSPKIISPSAGENLVSRCRPFTSFVIGTGRKGSGVSPIGNSYPFPPDSGG